MAIFDVLLTNRQRLEKHIFNTFQDFKRLLQVRISKQNEALEAGGLPVPRQLTSPSYEICERSSDGKTPSKVRLTLPALEIPEYFSFCIREDFWVIIPKEWNAAGETDVWSLYLQMGLSNIAKLNHVCFTDNPYSFYEDNNGRTDLVFDVRKDGQGYLEETYVYMRDVPNGPKRPRPIPALKPKLTLPQAAGIHFRAVLFNNLSNYLYGSPLTPDRMYAIGGVSHIIPKEVLLDLPVQMPYFYPPINEDPYTNFKVLPSETISPSLMVEFWQSLRPLNCPIAFEIIAVHGSVYFRLGVPTRHAEVVKRLLDRHFPQFAVMEDPEFSFQEGSVFTGRCAITDYSSSYPIKTLRQFSTDPYATIAHILDRNTNSFACFQVLLRPIPADTLDTLVWAIPYTYPWNEKIVKAANRLPKKWPLWAVGLNSLTLDEATDKELLQEFCAPFAEGQQHFITSNPAVAYSFIRISSSFSFFDTEELAGLAHFPVSALPLPSLETTSMKAQLPPELFRTGEVQIGVSEVRRQNYPVTLPDSIRDRHLYIVGKTRMGKSTLISNIALSDIDRGAGVCVIDPHGDLVEDLLNTIPQHRVADTIYFNANDKEHPIALNVFQARNDDEVALLADNLHVTFRRLSESWGQRMDDILRATLQTLAATPGSTFVDIKKLLQDAAFRGRVTANLDHPMLRDFWQLDFAAYPKDAPTPIISRVNRFLFAPHFYRMFSTAQNALSISDVVEQKKILLVNLASGAIGDDNATVLGSLLVSQIQQAVMRRAGLPKEARTPYYLFVDEFQNFTNSAFDKILSEAGKYNLCLTLAHQFISQLQDNQRDAIFGNVGTMIMFGVGDKDANYLRNQIGNFEPSDLLNMPPHQALCRPATSVAHTFHFKSLPPPHGRLSYAKEIIANTHSRYSINTGETKTGVSKTVSETKTPTQASAKEGRHIGFSPSPPLQAVVVQQPQPQSARPGQLQPAIALPKEFGSKAEKILYYIDLAEYLSTQQIIALCYSHQSEGSGKANASRDLGKLVDTKQIKVQPFGSGKIYTTARLINPTMHNLAVRDLLVKILQSRYEVAGVNLKPTLPSHNPDLEVSFLAETGELIKTFWEYDAATEGIEVLRKKFDCYAPYAKTAIISFVFNSEARWRQIAKGISQNGNGWAKLGVLSEFNTLDDTAFTIHGESAAQPFFGYFEK